LKNIHDLDNILDRISDPPFPSLRGFLKPILESSDTYLPHPDLLLCRLDNPGVGLFEVKLGVG
jgi:hypothetical protein